MFKRSLFALALAAALPMSAQAEELSYSYIQGGYSTASIDNLDFSGFGIKGSFAFNDSFYGFASYDSGDDNNIDLSQTTLGAGWHTAGANQWFIEASYVNNEVDFGGFGSSDDDGYSVAGGLRGKVSDNVELNGKLSYTDVGDFGDGLGLGVGAVVGFNEMWGAYVSYDYSDRGSNSELNTWGVGIRASF